MDELASLELRIKERLAAAEARRRESQEALKREMTAHEERAALFEQTASRLIDQVIRPRIARVASCFPNAHVEKPGAAANRCACRFDRTADYPASTKLEIGLSPGGDTHSVIATYALEILPVFFEFDGHDQLVLPLDAIDEVTVASWLDEKLLGFVDAYLRLPLVEQYQQENVVFDPVCGMRINMGDAGGSVEYQGRTYYFCVEQCRDKFLRDPVRYASGQPT